MTNIAWITDSTCALTEDYIKAHDIKVAPLKLILDDKEYKEMDELSYEEFYKLFDHNNQNATTSQPPIGEFVEIYEDIRDNSDYEVAIAIHASSKLTGTYQSSLAASDQTGFKTYVIDSKVGSYPLSKMIEAGIEMAEQGHEIERIVEVIQKMAHTLEMYLLPASLNQVKKSGRLTGAKSLLASILNLQLAIGFDDGAIVLKEKARSKKKLNTMIMNKMGELINPEHVKEICIMHCGNLDAVKEWEERIQSQFSSIRIVNQYLAPVAGVHTGLGTISIGWVQDFKSFL